MRAFYAWRGGIDARRGGRFMCGEGEWTSAYGRCEKDASGGWTAIPKSAVYARNAVST